MGKVSIRDKTVLEQLVLDCNMYNFSEKEALDYIKTRFGRTVSGRTYRRYKKNNDNGNQLQQWLNHFTKIGFVLHYKKQIDTIEIIQRDNLRQLFIEVEKRQQRDEGRILKLKHDIRENAKMLTELGLGTPIISYIKANSDRARRKHDELINKIRMKNPLLLKEL